MIIKAKVQTEKIIEKDITLPYFFKHHRNFYAVISEEKMVQVCPMPSYLGVVVSSPSIWIADIGDGEEITYREFADAVDTVVDAALGAMATLQEPKK